MRGYGEAQKWARNRRETKANAGAVEAATREPAGSGRPRLSTIQSDTSVTQHGLIRQLAKNGEKEKLTRSNQTSEKN